MFYVNPSTYLYTHYMVVISGDDIIRDDLCLNKAKALDLAQYLAEKL